MSGLPGVLLGAAVLLGPALAVLVWRLTDRNARILRARRREQRRRDRLRRLEQREAARLSDAEVHAHRRGVAP